MMYLLDFDHTLMDTEALKVQVRNDGRLHLVGKVEFWEYYRATDFLFPDVLPWISHQSKESLHILTAFQPNQGVDAKAFQEAKIASNGLGDVFQSVTVVEGLKGIAAAQLVELYSAQEPVIFVDDRLDQCLSVLAAVPRAHCFLMHRDGDIVPHIPDDLRVVSSLHEVDAIMKAI